MATIVTRSGKGSPLTNNEVDANFTNLNTELGTKADTSSLATVATTGAYADLTGKPTLVDASNVAITGGSITGTTIDSITNHVGADHIHYKIKATQILAKGDVVKVVGFNAGENAFEVAKVSASTDIAVGVVYSALANGGLGSIINTGLLEGIDTSAFAIGTTLYPNTSGGFTSTKPTSGRYQALAFVVRSNANNGTILIEASEPQATSLSQFTNDSGYITGITSGNVTTALGYTPYNATNPSGYITSAGSISGNAATATNISNTGTVTLASATESNSIYATAPSYGADQPTKLLNFDWYSNVFSLGNIRSTSTDSNGFGVYYTATGGSRTELARFFPNGNFGIGTITAPERLTIAGNIRIGNAGEPNAYNINIVGRSPAAGTIDWDFKTNDATYGARTAMTISATGSVVANFDVRAPIFYDSNNTGYYVDAASNSALYQLTTGVGINLNGGIALVASGATLANSIGARLTESYGPVWNLGDGATWHHQVINGSMLCGFSALGTNWGSGNIIANGYLRGTLFYDQSDTAYYVDPNSLSNLVTIYATKTAANNTPAIQVRGGYAGYPRIQTYGLDNDPNAWMGLGTDMAGGPYEHSIYFPNGSFGTQGNGRLSIGDYNGTTYNPRLWVYPTYTQINNSTRSPLFYDSDNTGYYVDPNGVTRINKLTAGERSLVGYSTISMSGLDANTWYPVTIPVPVARQTTLRIENALNSNAPSWSTHPSGFSCYIEWTTNGLGWGTIGISRRVTDWREQFTTVQIVGGITQLGNGSTEVIWLRGGANYFFSADCDVTPTIRTTLYDLLGQTVEPRSTVFNDPWATAVGKMSYGTFQANERVTAATDIRAPIFYDSNDTGYFLDPTSNATSMRTAGSWITNPTSTWGGEVAGKLEYHNNRWYASVQTAFVVRSTTGSEVLWAYNTGVVEASNDFRAPIFYDSNNTAYYINPNSTSQVSGANFNFGATGRVYDDGNFHIDGLNSPVWINSIGNSTIELNTQTSGYVNIGNSARAPIYYDSANTAYYVDPHSTSVLLNLNLNGGLTTNGSITVGNGAASSDIYMADSDEGTRRIHCNSNRIGFLTQAEGWGSFCSDNGDWTTEATGYAASSFRAPIFYDNNNTAYYVDGNFTSRLNNLSLDTIAVTSGITGLTSAPITTQYANAVTTNTWYPMTYQRAQHSGGYVTHLNTGLYKDVGAWGSGATGWYAAIGGSDVSPTQAWYLTYDGFIQNSLGYVSTGVSFRAPTFYDSQNTNYYVDPVSGFYLGGDGSTTYQSTGSGLFITNPEGTGAVVRLGAAWSRAGSYSNGSYTLGSESSIHFWISNSEKGYIDSSSNLFMNGSVRAPIFYDSNNTAFYVDPATDTRLGGTLLVGPTGAGAYTRFGSSAGDTTHATVAASNGNLHIDAQGGYSLYLNWYNSLPIWTEAVIYAPLYYDRNNSGFYVNPASESRLERLVLSARYDNYFVGSMAVVNAVSNFQTLTDTFGQMSVMQVSDTGGFTNAPTGLYPYGAVMSWRTENHSYQMYASHTGDLAYKTQWQNDNYSGWLSPMVYGRNGNSSSGKTVYGSVYYDTDNTGYFVNPTTSSTLANLDLTSIIDSPWYYDAAIEIRERQFGGVLTTSLNNAPRLGFHWGGRTAMQLVLDSGGTFNVMNGDCGAYSSLASGNFTANGSITATGNVTAYSDIRIKANVETIPSALDKLDLIRGVTYTRTDLDDKEQRYAGVIAQEIEAVLPEAVRDLGDIKAVDYNATIALLIQAVKELRDEVEMLRK